MILPLMAGVVVATITSQDPAIELQLTLPKNYHLTAMGRLTIIAAWTACIPLFSSSITTALNVGYMPEPLHTWLAPFQFLIGELTWFATLLWFVAVGLCLAILTRSRAATVALLLDKRDARQGLDYHYRRYEATR